MTGERGEVVQVNRPQRPAEQDHPCIGLRFQSGSESASRPAGESMPPAARERGTELYGEGLAGQVAVPVRPVPWPGPPPATAPRRLTPPNAPIAAAESTPGPDPDGYRLQRSLPHQAAPVLPINRGPTISTASACHPLVRSIEWQRYRKPARTSSALLVRGLVERGHQPQRVLACSLNPAHPLRLTRPSLTRWRPSPRRSRRSGRH